MSSDSTLIFSGDTRSCFLCWSVRKVQTALAFEYSIPKYCAPTTQCKPQGSLRVAVDQRDCHYNCSEEAGFSRSQEGIRGSGGDIDEGLVQNVEFHSNRAESTGEIEGVSPRKFEHF